MLFGRMKIAYVPLILVLGACTPKSGDEGQASGGNTAVAAELQPGKTAASLQLDAVVELVKGDEVADAKSLEAKINDPEAKLNAVDLDDDGETDFIEVVEVKKGDKTVLELRAIPSSKQDQDVAEVAVVVATVELYVENKEMIVVHATYTEHIEHDAEVHVYHHERPAFYEDGVLVVADGCFFHYVFVHEHELYLGHHHVVVIEAPHLHHKHKKHKKHKHHKGHGHGHGHGSHVVVTW
jgi:hypothetical protein